MQKSSCFIHFYVLDRKNHKYTIHSNDSQYSFLQNPKNSTIFISVTASTCSTFYNITSNFSKPRLKENPILLVFWHVSKELKNPYSTIQSPQTTPKKPSLYNLSKTELYIFFVSKESNHTLLFNFKKKLPVKSQLKFGSYSKYPYSTITFCNYNIQ